MGFCGIERVLWRVFFFAFFRRAKASARVSKVRCVSLHAHPRRPRARLKNAKNKTLFVG